MKHIFLFFIIASVQFAQLKCYATLSEVAKHAQLHENEVISVEDESDHDHHAAKTHSHKHRHASNQAEHEHSHTHLNTSTGDAHFLYSNTQFFLNTALDNSYSFKDKDNLRPYQFIFEIFRPPIA